jgi:hypothetical protein
MAFCGSCGSQTLEGDRFCRSCGGPTTSGAPASIPPVATMPAEQPPVQAAATPIGYTRSTTPNHPAPSNPAAQTTVGGTTFTWPLPEQTMQVSGRTLPVELVVVAAVYCVAGLWMLWQLQPLVQAIPDLLRGLFSSDSFEYSFTYLSVFLLAMVLFVGAALLGVAYLLLRADPVGRGLSVVIFLALIAAAAALNTSTSALYILILLVSACSTAALFVSPWCRHALDTSPRGDGRPTSVVLSRTLILAFFSLLTFETAVMLLGLRFTGTLGASFVIATVLFAAACALAWFGHSRLSDGPDRGGRIQVSVAAGLSLLGSAILGGGSAWVFQLVLLGGATALLWAAPGARTWFGQKPLWNSPGLS